MKDGYICSDSLPGASGGGREGEGKGRGGWGKRWARIERWEELGGGGGLTGRTGLGENAGVYPGNVQGGERSGFHQEGAGWKNVPRLHRVYYEDRVDERNCGK